MTQDPFNLVGTVIDDKYHVDSVVGEGGYGVVYKGYRPDMGLEVAIKCLKLPAHFTLEARAAFYEQFRTEAKLLTRLRRHGSIVQVFDFGDLQGGKIPYLVLEWLEGNDLEHHLQSRNEPFSEGEALSLLRPALEAVGVAHHEKVIHQDLKPANLFLTDDGAGGGIKVLDFGIARAMETGQTLTLQAVRDAEELSPFTPAYGAPEQFDPKTFGPVGPWTDVHAFGLILVEMVAGAKAYEAEGPFALMAEATSERRPLPRSRGANVSEAFEQVCVKALALHPADRYQSASELARALESVLYFGRAQSNSRTQQPSSFTRGAQEADTMPSASVAAQSETETKVMLSGGPSPRARTVWFMGAGVLLAPVAALALWYGWSSEPVASAPPRASSTTFVPKAPPPCDKDMIAVEGGVFEGQQLDGYCLDRTEVTARSYAACVEARACGVEVKRPFSSRFDAGKIPLLADTCTFGNEALLRHPINCVDWGQAVQFCAWKEKRLPSEAEWAYAAAGPEGRRYPWGADAPGPTLANACGNECVTWARDRDLDWGTMLHAADGWPTTAAVGSYPEGNTPSGLVDMAGNVREWTSTKAAGAAKHMVRGGGWTDGEPEDLQTRSRFGLESDTRTISLGFRCAK